MRMELQVALNFLISFLYNKLPRRRVNHFGEELEKALRVKFQGHWYPEQPFKGSAYRCVKTTPPLDPAFEMAARESGMDIRDIEQNLPHELSIWIDPGEVSYRMSEKGPVKVLYSESDTIEERADREVTKTFNPEAQCFKPVDSISSQMTSLTVEEPASTTCAQCASSPSPGCERCSHSPFSSSSSPPSSYKSVSPTPPAFLTNKTPQPLTFTTATFAQTKFGSTKLKTNSKRNNGQRMSPTEFSNYIKQRAMAQQVAQQQLASVVGGSVSPLFDRPRSLSPAQPSMDPSMLLYNQPVSQLSPVYTTVSSAPSGYPIMDGRYSPARSPSRSLLSSMQDPMTPNGSNINHSHHNQLTVSMPSPIGASVQLSGSSGNVSSASSASPPSDYTEFSIAYSARPPANHHLLVAN